LFIDDAISSAEIIEHCDYIKHIEVDRKWGRRLWPVWIASWAWFWKNKERSPNDQVLGQV